MTTERALFGSAVRGIFASLGSDALQKVAGLAGTFIVLQALAPYEYGLWQLVLSVLTLFDVLLIPSIASMLIADTSREIGEGRSDRAGAIVAQAAPLFIGLGLAGALLMILFAPYIAQASGIDLTLLIRVLALALVAEGILQIYQLVLQGTLALVHAQILKALKRLAYFVGVTALVLGLPLGVTGIVYAYVFSLFIPVLLYAPVIYPRFISLVRGRERSGQSFFEAAWKRGQWALLGDFTTAISAALWPWILGYYLSIAEVGYVSLAILVLGQVASLAPVSFVLRSVLPRTVGTEGRTRAWLMRSMKYAIWSQMAGGLAIVSGSAIVVPLLFPAYAPVIALTAAILLTLPVRVVGVVASEWFFAAKQQRTLFFISNLPKVLLLALLPLFLMWFGLVGFVVWYLINAEIITYLRLRMIGREEGGAITLREIIFPDREDGVILSRVLGSLSRR